MSDTLSEEIEVLKSIYLDELMIEELKDYVQLSIRICSGKDDQQLVSVLVVLIIPSDYPNVVPTVSIRNPRGLEESFVQKLEVQLDQLIADKCGHPVLFDVINHVQDVVGELTAPQIPCSICLWHFHHDDQIFRTPCDHFFHRICFFRYALHQLNLHQSDATTSAESLTELLCPVCRSEVGDVNLTEFENAPAPILELDTMEDLNSSFQRDKWAEVYERQQRNGGIIDLDAEANKFLVDENTTVTLPPTEADLNAAVSEQLDDSHIAAATNLAQRGNRRTYEKGRSEPHKYRHWRGPSHMSNRPHQYRNRPSEANRQWQHLPPKQPGTAGSTESNETTTDNTSTDHST